jgi:molecular chaperone Hsp33
VSKEVIYHDYKKLIKNTNMSNSTLNTVTTFLINESSIRGRVCKVTAPLHKILTAHEYPEYISQLLGELMILAVMIGNLSKSNKLTTLQLKAEGPIKLMVADYTAEGKIRAYTNWDKKQYQDLADKGLLTFHEMFKTGILAVIVEQNSVTDSYQGIVELCGNSLAESIESYFLKSEQILATFKVAVGRDMTAGTEQWCGGGIMIQALPSAIKQPDEWETNAAFVNSVEMVELIDPLLSSTQLLYRLFHEIGVWVNDATEVEFGCRCSRERAENILKTLPSGELETLKQDGKIVVTCQFCNNTEVFTEQ